MANVAALTRPGATDVELEPFGLVDGEDHLSVGVQVPVPATHDVHVTRVHNLTSENTTESLTNMLDMNITIES